jgi:predicted cobalt transporter CbtA
MRLLRLRMVLNYSGLHLMEGRRVWWIATDASDALVLRTLKFTDCWRSTVLVQS